MSKFCIAIISNISNSTYLCSQITDVVDKCNLGVTFQLDYREPFIDQFCTKTDLICSFTDSSTETNCERLLLPDNCSVNGYYNSIDFDYKMQKLKSILEVILASTSIVNLFIGEGGVMLDDFLESRITIVDFIKAAHCLNSSYSPDVHFVITGDK